MRQLFAVFLFLMSFSVAGGSDSPYAIPRSDLPDLDYAADPQLYSTLEKSYLKIFKSSAGQSILGTFEDCRENYFTQHFELRGSTAEQARVLCENARSRMPKKVLSPNKESYSGVLRKYMSSRVSSDPRQHFLKLASHREEISSYTYLGNQTIVRLPDDLVYDEDILSALLFHEMTIYFDRKNPTNLLGILQDHGLTMDHFNIDLQILWQVWNNPFLSEALSVLRSYQQEKIFLPQLSRSAHALLSNKWFNRLNEVQNQKNCGALVVDYIAEVLMQDETYLAYRWTSSADYRSHIKGGRPSASRAEIQQKTQEDLETFLKARIHSSQINMSLCEFALIPQYGSDGILLNHGPRPPIKPGSPNADGKWNQKPQVDVPKDLRTKWEFYRELKGPKALEVESVEKFQNKIKEAQNGK